MVIIWEHKEIACLTQDGRKVKNDDDYDDDMTWYYHSLTLK